MMAAAAEPPANPFWRAAWRWLTRPKPLLEAVTREPFETRLIPAAPATSTRRPPPAPSMPAPGVLSPPAPRYTNEPEPWHGIRCVVVGLWRQAFRRGRRPDADRDELLATVALRVAERFTADEIETSPGRVVEYARTIAARIVAEAVGSAKRLSGDRKKATRRRADKHGILPGLNAITSDPRTAAIDTLPGDDAAPDLPHEDCGAGWERIAPWRALTEDELIAAIDLRRQGQSELVDTCEELAPPIVLTAPFEFESFWSRVQDWARGHTVATFLDVCTPSTALRWYVTSRDRYGAKRITATEATIDVLASGYQPAMPITNRTTPRDVFDHVFATVQKAFARADEKWIACPAKKPVEVDLPVEGSQRREPAFSWTLEGES